MARPVMEPHVLAVDPGGTIGLAWAPLSVGSLKGGWKEAKEKFGWQDIETRGVANMMDAERLKIDPDSHAILVIIGLVREKNVKVIVPETFSHRPGSVLKGDVLSAPRQLGALRYALDTKWWDGMWSPQTPSQKDVVSDTLLKGSGLWVVGSTHMRDAVRHLVVFFRRLKEGKV